MSEAGDGRPDRRQRRVRHRDGAVCLVRQGQARTTPPPSPSPALEMGRPPGAKPGTSFNAPALRVKQAGHWFESDWSESRLSGRKPQDVVVRLVLLPILWGSGAPGGIRTPDHLIRSQAKDVSGGLPTSPPCPILRGKSAVLVRWRHQPSGAIPRQSAARSAARNSTRSQPAWTCLLTPLLLRSRTIWTHRRCLAPLAPYETHPADRRKGGLGDE